MEVADAHRPARGAHVQPLGLQPGLQGASRYLGQPSGDRLFELAAHLVGQLPQRRSLVGWRLAQAAHQARQLAGASQQRVAHLLDRGDIRRRRQAGGGIGPELFEPLSKIVHRSMRIIGQKRTTPLRIRSRAVVPAYATPASW